MTVYVQVPPAWRASSDAASLSVQGATVADALEAAGRHAPQLKDRTGLRVFLNQEDIRYLQGEKTALQDGDLLVVVPTVATASSRPAAALSTEERQRYSRHLLLPEIGLEGQLKLKQARVLVIGAGGLGSPAALYLAAAGVGTLGLVDFDRVDASNLQRQLLHDSSRVGHPKLESARARLREVNPHVQVVPHETRLSAGNALSLLAAYDVILDGTDNFPTRYLVNDACVMLDKPNVHGSIFRFEGQASVFWASRGPCYRCLYPEPPPPGLTPSCAEAGVLGVLPGMIGMIQATEAIKLILGIGEPLVGRLLLYHALQMSFRELKIPKDDACPACGRAPTLHRLSEEAGACCAPAPSLTSPETDVHPRALRQELDQRRPLVLLDVREPREFDICRLPDARLIPLRELPDRVGDLDRRAHIVCYCRSGARSAQAAEFLRSEGFAHVRNLVGGILAWSDEVDPALPKY